MKRQTQLLQAKKSVDKQKTITLVLRMYLVCDQM